VVEWWGRAKPGRSMGMAILAPDFEMVPAEPKRVRARLPTGDDAAPRAEQDMV